MTKHQNFSVRFQKKIYNIVLTSDRLFKIRFKINFPDKPKEYNIKKLLQYLLSTYLRVVWPYTVHYQTDVANMVDAVHHANANILAALEHVFQDSQ